MTEDRANPLSGEDLGDGVQSLAGRGIWCNSAVWKKGLKPAGNVPSGEFCGAIGMKKRDAKTGTKKIRARGADFLSG
ncbi:hypothetical protein PQR53_07895 [Paraburkholderia fungorum]|uniref:hypothetical protein n=1 Tax=Paraburkholderia fungorum TaxID=134537 RepID=UPI0038BCFBD6